MSADMAGSNCCRHAIVLIALSGCAGCGSSAESAPGGDARPARAPGTFRGLPVNARVAPSSGGPHTVFRVRFRPREFVGHDGDALRSYEARLRAAHDRASCIIDTGGFLDTRHPRRGIVLDPNHQMGGRWCRDRFTGSVTYHSAYACPAHGTCRPPKEFRERQRRVARIAFTVR
jgi:hypothetical protein